MTFPAATALLSLLCIVAAVWPVCGFNLDTKMPIVKRGRNPGSYFGFSVAGHQSTGEYDKKRVVDTWILVGAPLDNNLQPYTNRSGALWKCPLTSFYDDCEQVITDGRRTCNGFSPSNYEYLQPPRSDEIKENQWMGVLVRSKGRGGNVMVCAHRYINIGTYMTHNKWKNKYWVLGLCYILTQNLDCTEIWEPCRTGNIDYTINGYCQAGTSGVLLEDDSIVIGAPGSYLWKGNIIVRSKLDNFQHYSPIQDGEQIFVEKFDYLGMSTTGGFFLGSKTMVYVAGAPRANGTGQVFLFTKQENDDILSILRGGKHAISGEQLGSNFGYELATADLNGDKKPDLIVGAPFYFNESNGGAVYIYMNNKYYCLDCKSPIKLVGKPESRFGFAITNLGDLNKDGYEDIAIGAPYEENGVVYVYQGSYTGIDIKPLQIIKAENLVVNGLKIRTFGYSLSGNGMDLDQNGYPDLISGAYDSEMAILLRARPIVNIDIGVDEHILKNIDPINASCSVNGNTFVNCFSFRTCCLLKSEVKAGLSWNSRSQLRYKLEAETFREDRIFSRIWFRLDDTTKSHVSENVVNVNHNNQQICQTHTAYIKENTKDFISPIAMRISYSLEQNNIPILNPGDPVPSLDDFPILNQRQAIKTFYAMFHTDCRNALCESQVHVNAHFALPPKKKNEYNLILGKHVEILLNTTAYNTGESAYESRMFISHPSSFNYIGIMKLENTRQLDCNPFNKTTVVCTLGNPFKKSASSNIQLRFDLKDLDDVENKVQFIVTSNSTSHETDPQSPIILHVNVIKQAELSLKGTARPEQVFYGGQGREYSSLKYRDEVGSKIVHTYQVFNSGPWKVSNLEVHIDWPFQLINRDLPDPSQGNWLLYLDEKPYIEALSGGECWTPLGQVNPLGLPIRPGVLEASLDQNHSHSSTLKNRTTSKSATNVIKNSTDFRLNRIRRNLNYSIRPETHGIDNENNSKVVKMNCSLGNVKCLKILCQINNLQSNQEATITIKARMWNSTLIQFFPNEDLVQIASRGKIYIPSNLSLQQDHILDDECVVISIAKVDLLVLQGDEPMSWWNYVLAILTGLGLLSLLILVLEKVGFFIRKRPGRTYSGGIDKQKTGDDFDYEY